MRYLSVLLVSFMVFSSCDRQEPMRDLIERSMDVAVYQAAAMGDYLQDKEERLPRNYNKEKDEIVTSNSKWWCSGFYPGVLWYLYEYTEDDQIRMLAEHYSARVEEEKYNTYDHDIGFQIYCSFGNGYRLTGREDYREVLKTAGRSAIERYNPHLGVIRSWDFNRDRWQYPVIIDNMMNLELLMWNFDNTGDSVFWNVAISHSDKTLEHHFRPDNSSHHVVSYDTISGLPHIKQTHQGATDESIWARGQAWGLYGYTKMYREAGLDRYLDQAVAIANLMIDHENMPDDGIPYWDYNAPNIPETSRDASAAAIMVSALIELSTYVEGELSNKFLSMAEKQLRTLSSPEYLAEPGTNGYFILMNSVGHFRANSEVDVPLTYADYYYIEALLRYKKLKGF